MATSYQLKPKTILGQILLSIAVAGAFAFVVGTLKNEGLITDEEFSHYCKHPSNLWADLKAGKFGDVNKEKYKQETEDVECTVVEEIPLALAGPKA